MRINVIQFLLISRYEFILGVGEVHKFDNQYAVKYRNFFFRSSPWIKIPFKGYSSSNEYIIFPIITNVGTIYFSTSNYTIAFQDISVGYVNAAGYSLSLNSKVENGFMYFQVTGGPGYNTICFIPYVIYCSPTRLDEHLSYDFETQ